MRRVISLIDMDCFYAQVEQRENPTLWGQPVIVVQHSRQGDDGGILAVSYEARAFGVKRGMSVADAKMKCPQLMICRVPIGEYADKADIQKYRDASAEIFRVLHNFDSQIVVEKASVDEAFLDLTSFTNHKLQELSQSETLEQFFQDAVSNLPTTHIANGQDSKESDHLRTEFLSEFIKNSKYSDENLLILIAAVTVETIRQRIRDETNFYCSAGIANNKMMAKLVCARHKPRQQTLVPWFNVKEILRVTPIGDVRGFGGKLGNRIQEKLNITLMGEILQLPIHQLVESFPDQHEWLMAVAEGHDDEPVRPRKDSSSIGVSKNFPGKLAIRTTPELKKWMIGLTRELSKRLMADQAENKRTAENLVYSVLTDDGKPQKTLKITSYHPDVVFEQIWSAIRGLNKSNLAKEEEGPWTPAIQNISLTASRFQPGILARNRSIHSWIQAREDKKRAREEYVYKEEGEDVIVLEEPEKQPTETFTTSKPKMSTEITAEGIEVIVLDDSDEDVAPPPPPPPLHELSPFSRAGQIEYVTVDGKRISKQILSDLPPVIKKQYEHRMILEEARQMKEASAKKLGAAGTRKRTGPINSDAQKRKKSKPLESFFKKKT